MSVEQHENTPSIDTGRQGPVAVPAGSPTTSAETRPYLLERVDDAAVVQLYADGFAALPLEQKILI